MKHINNIFIKTNNLIKNLLDQIIIPWLCLLKSMDNNGIYLCNI